MSHDVLSWRIEGTQEVRLATSDTWEYLQFTRMILYFTANIEYYKPTNTIAIIMITVAYIIYNNAVVYINDNIDELPLHYIAYLLWIIIQIKYVIY